MRVLHVTFQSAHVVFSCIHISITSYGRAHMGGARVDGFMCPRASLRSQFVQRRSKADKMVAVVRMQAKPSEAEHELRVCTHRTCCRSGSLQTLDVLRSLAPPNVSVDSCGCLGRCGSGPNLVLLPAGLMVSYCSTPAHAARLLDVQCGVSGPDNNLAALALRQRGDKAAELGELGQAEKFYTEVIGSRASDITLCCVLIELNSLRELNPTGGLHYIYVNRSSSRLAMGDFEGALSDAKQAAELHPKWPLAYLRQADAYTKMGNYDAALNYLSTALGLDPSLRRSKSFQRKLLEIQRKVNALT